MKILWRVTAGVISIPLFIGICAIVWLGFFFDPENYRESLIDWIVEATGSDVTISGKLTFDVGISNGTPRLNFVIDGLSLKSAEEFDRAQLFRAASLKVAISASNLIRGRIEPSITVVGPELNLIRRDVNRTNWHNVGRNLLGRQQAFSEWELITGFSGISSMGIRIVDGTMRWRDTDKEADLRLSNIDLEVIPLGPKRTVSLQANWQSKKILFDTSGYVDSSMELLIDKKSGSISAEDVTLNLTGPLTLVRLDIHQVEVDQARQLFNFRGTNVSGAVQGEEFLFKLEEGVYFQASDSLVLENVETEWIGSQIESAAHLSMFSVGSIKEILLRYRDDKRLLTRFETSDKFFAIFDRTLLASGQIMFSVSDWNKLAFPNIKASVLGDNPFEAIIDLSIGEYGTDVDAFDLSWTSSKMLGSLIRKGSKRAALVFNVQEDYVDLESTSLFDAKAIHNPAIKFLGLFLSYRDIVTVGTIEIGRVSWDDITVHQVEIPLNAESDIWRANDVTFELYGGDGIAEFVITKTDSGFVLEARQRYFAVDIGSFLSEIGLTDRVQAIGHLEVLIVSSIPINSSVNESVRGHATIVIPKGQVSRLGDLLVPHNKVSLIVEEILALIDSDLEVDFLQDDVNFTEFQAKMVLKDRNLFSDDISLRIPGWNLKGEGTYDLVLDKYDSIWYLSSEGRMQPNENSLLQRLQTLIIPLRISGHSRSISAALDVPEFLRLLSP